MQTARVAISANVAGRVLELDVRDNQPVHKGDVLFRLDDAPFRIAVEEAGAQLAAARLQVESLKANYRQRQAELASAQDTLAFQQREFERQQRLLGSGIASQLQVDRAVACARRGAHAGRRRAAADRRRRRQPRRQPEHRAGSASRRCSRRRRCSTAPGSICPTRSVTAPSDGVVTRVEQLQVGSYINASAPVFALVSTGDIWIEANFKEDQLTHMRVGQAASVEVDSYPGKTLRGQGGERQPGHRLAVLGAAAGERDRQLGQGRAAAAGARRARTTSIRRFRCMADLSANVSVDTRHRAPSVRRRPTRARPAQPSREQ